MKLQAIHYIHIKEKSERIDFIKLLESKGYTISIYSRKEDIISSVLPITVDVKKKIIDIMGNVTCAAAAGSSNLLEDKQTFLDGNI